LRRQDRPQDPVQVDPAAPDQPGRVRVPLDGRIETEADIAETEVPVEVEDIDDPIAAGGDVRHGPLGVLGDAELADEVVAAAAGDDAQRGVRIDEAGRNRTRHPIAAESTTRGAPSAAKPAASS